MEVGYDRKGSTSDLLTAGTSGYILFWVLSDTEDLFRGLEFQQ